MKKALLFSTLVLLLCSFVSTSFAVEVILHEEKYVRTDGDPNLWTTMFPASGDEARLVVKNGNPEGESRINSTDQVSSAVIMINGVQILGPKDFNQNIYEIEISLFGLGEENSISVELRSKPESFITVQIIQEVEAEAGGVIGPGGGIVEVTDPNSPIYGARVEVPENGLATKVIISILGNYELAGIINIELAPHGTLFNEPVYIVIPYHDEDNNGIIDNTSFDENELFVFITDKKAISWEPLAIINHDIENNNITVSTNHFSLLKISGDVCLNPLLDPQKEIEFIRENKVIFNFDNPADIIVFKGDIANEIRNLSGSDQHIMAVSLFAAICFDEYVNAFLGSGGDLSKFVGLIAEGKEPEIIASELSHGLSNLSDLFLGLFNYWKAYKIEDIIKKTENEFYLVLPRYKTKTENKSYYNGQVYIIDKLCMKNYSHLKPFSEILYFESLDEKKRKDRRCTCTLQQEEKNKIYPNCATKKFFGGWDFSICPSECDDSLFDSWSCPLLFSYKDNDGDTFGSQFQIIANTYVPDGYVLKDFYWDCNDNNQNIYPGAMELCNNIDDDCNTFTPDGYDGIAPYNTLQEGICYKSLRSCINGTWEDDYSKLIAYEENETGCDNLDNDCDGQVDEYLTQQCGITDIGTCEYGIQTCSSGNWSVCNGNIDPIEEICGDSLDNNCDGKTDEGCFITGDIYVDDDYPTPVDCSERTGTNNTPYCTIQEGIDASNDGDTVIVAAGTYNELINYDGKAITVRTDEGAVIDGSSLGGSVVTFNSSEDTDSILKGFTIQGGSASIGGGILCFSSPIISDCTITNNFASSYGGGIGFSNSSSATIRNCIISGNETSNDGGGINISDDSTPLILNSIISGNYASDDAGGIRFFASSLPKIKNSTISRNFAKTRGGGISCGPSSSPTIVNSIIWGNKALGGGNEIFLSSDLPLYISYSIIDPSQIGGSGTPILTNNKSFNPLFINSVDISLNPTSEGDYHLKADSPCINEGTLSGAPEYDIDGDPRLKSVGGDDMPDMGADEYIDQGAICIDSDNDGYYSEPGCGTEVDCDDTKWYVSPWVLEDGSGKCSDGLDNDCDGYIDAEDNSCEGYI